MASRDLTAAYFDRRTASLKRRATLGTTSSNGIVDHNGRRNKPTNRLTAGGSQDDDDGHSLMLMEVSGFCLFYNFHEKVYTVHLYVDNTIMQYL